MKRFASIVLALLLALLCGCQTKELEPVSVQSVSMITGYGALGLNARHAGIVEAGQTVGVERAEGMELGELYVQVGDEVREGAPLFCYDTDAIQLELEKAELERDQMENSVTTKTAQIAALEKEKATAKAEQQIDYTLQIQELELDLSEAKLNIAAKEKEIERLRQMTEQTEVVSPCAGRVQAINDPEGETFDAAKPYLTIAQAGLLRVKGTVSELYADAILPGTPVLLRSRTDDSRVWHGEIESVDFSSPVQSGNGYMDYGGGDEMTSPSKYYFYVTLYTDDGLMMGQHLYIEPEAGQEEQGLYLFSAYLCDTDSAPYVWAANTNGTLEKRSVTLGSYDESADSWEILDGLGPTDYIAFPDESCAVGAPVILYNEDSFDNGGFDNEDWAGEAGGVG